MLFSRLGPAHAARSRYVQPAGRFIVQATDASEFVPRAKLHVSRTVELSDRLSEAAASEVSVRKVESGCVGKVEEFSAELEFQVFTYGEFFAKRKIGVMDTVATKIREIARRVSGHVVPRKREAACVEHGSRCGIDILPERKLHSGDGSIVVADYRKKRWEQMTFGRWLPLAKSGLSKPMLIGVPY